MTHYEFGDRKPLTKVQQRVYDLLVQGLTNKEIGAKLFKSESAVVCNVTAIMAKTSTRSRVEAALAYMPGPHSDITEQDWEDHLQQKRKWRHERHG